MAASFNLERFVDAQQGAFDSAVSELSSGSKQGHWMWFIFPQLEGLGHSATSKFYAIRSLAEADAYLHHPLLGPRLRQSVEALKRWTGVRTAEQILGPVDALKLKSSLTLFDVAKPGDVFDRALLNFFRGARDELTLALLSRQQ